MKKKHRKKGNKTLFWILLAAVGLATTALLVFAFLHASGVFDTPKEADRSDEGRKASRSETTGKPVKVADEDEELRSYAEQMAVDAESYLEEKGQILSETKVSKSKSVETEAAASENLSSRGFSQDAVVSEFSMDGEYSEAKEVSAAGSSRHPVYETYYTAESGDLWMILSINGAVMANPISYNAVSERAVPVVLSESTSLVSYDNISGRFYETIPDPSELIVVVVDRIDAQTLDRMTAAELDRY